MSSSFQNAWPNIALLFIALAAWRWMNLVNFSRLLVTATLCLIFVGGMVTSKNAGLAVPDWPTSFGYNMFSFPTAYWVGGIFYEHAHRLVASFVGLLTLILSIRVARDAKPLRLLGFSALALVIAQGIMGGLRVTELSVALAIIHACTAQAFLCLVIILSMRLAGDRGRSDDFAMKTPAFLRVCAWAMVVAVYGQLILGATMRHLGAALAFKDFPLAAGKIFPPLNTFAQTIHFSHRVGALIVSILAVVLFFGVIAGGRGEKRLVMPAFTILALIAFQISLGAHIVWLGTEIPGASRPQVPPLTATLHVVTGATILGLSLVVAMRARSARLSADEESSTALEKMREFAI